MMQLQCVLFLVVLANACGFSILSPRASIGRKNGLKMLTIEQEVVSINTPTGPMKTAILKPTSPGKYPGILFYSEIFQVRKYCR
jgi:hypothetical protein